MDIRDYLIEGVSGTGKSTVAEALEYRCRNPVRPDVFKTDSDGGSDDDYHYRL
jgi:thymidylate kinase